MLNYIVLTHYYMINLLIIFESLLLIIIIEQELGIFLEYEKNTGDSDLKKKTI